VDTLRTAGLAFARAKNGLASPTNDTVRKYGFLGDPAIRPPLPRGAGVWEKQPLDSVLRGDVVTLRGHAVMGPADSTRYLLSMGTVDLLLQDLHLTRRDGQPAAKERGLVLEELDLRLQLVDLLLVPLGALVVVGHVRILHRVSPRCRAVPDAGAASGSRSIRCGCRLLLAARGCDPPTIQVVYPAPDSLLHPGSHVTLVLSDSSGIDLTRLDNAHSIFVIVDDRGTPYEVTAGFAAIRSELRRAGWTSRFRRGCRTARIISRSTRPTRSGTSGWRT
jgi:hypothetical protein